MARINCYSFLSRTFSVLCWLFILASFIVPMFIVGYVLILAFRPFSEELSAEHVHNKLGTPVWSDSFDYGVKVYASLELDTGSNTANFFESAQLLWHVDSVSASKKYPKLASSVVVDVPDMLYSADNRNSALYAHIFIQASNSLLPYPNIDDTTLVYTTTKLVHWRPVAKAANSTDNYSPEYELVAATKVPWAIYLENYTYIRSRKPRLISKAAGSISSKGDAGYMYKPPVLNNTFTETAGKVKQLALLQSNGTLVSDFDSTTAVQLKLQGVRMGWIRLRVALNEVTKRFKSINVFDTVKLKPKYLLQTPRFGIMSETDILSLLQKQSIVSLLTAYILFIFFLNMLLVFLHTSTALWWDSRSNYDGVSRAAFLMQCSSIFAEGAMRYFKSSTLPYNIVIMEITKLLIIIELPYNPSQWPGYITGKIALYKQASAHNSCGGADKDQPGQSIAIIRRNVDSTAFKWIRLVYFPIVIAVILHALAYSTDGKRGVFKQVAGSSFNILSCICFVPQIILNHKARSGSLIPPIISISYLIHAIFFYGCKYSVGLTKIGFPETNTLILLAGYMVFVIQWILYR